MSNVQWHTYKTIVQPEPGKPGLYRCNCGSEFKTEDDAMEHIMGANEEQAKELRKFQR